MFRQPGRNGKEFTWQRPSTLPNFVVRLLTQPYRRTFGLFLRASLWKDFSADPATLQIRYFPLFLILTFIILWPETTVQWTALLLQQVFVTFLSCFPLRWCYFRYIPKPRKKKTSAISRQAQITTPVAKAQRIWGFYSRGTFCVSFPRSDF